MPPIIISFQFWLLMKNYFLLLATGQIAARRKYLSVVRHLQRTYNDRKIYKIFLDNKLIGMTKLGLGDPQMGVVFGQINFTENNIGYDFIKKYCIDNLIEIQTDYPTDKLITTGKIEKLKFTTQKTLNLLD